MDVRETNCPDSRNNQLLDFFDREHRFVQRKLICPTIVLSRSPEIRQIWKSLPFRANRILATF